MFNLRNNGAIYRLVLWISQTLGDITSSPTITAGTGAPTAAEPNGSTYHRTNGSIYKRTGGAWVEMIDTSVINDMDFTANADAAAGANEVGSLRAKSSSVAEVHSVVLENDATNNWAALYRLNGATPVSTHVHLGVPGDTNLGRDITITMDASTDAGLANPATIVARGQEDDLSFAGVATYAFDGNITVTGTVDGRDVATDGGKLDGVESGADVTDATNVAAAGAVMESDTTTAAMNFVVDEDSMVSNLDTKVPTQQSVKAYVDGRVAGLLDYKGGYNAATNTPDLDTTPSGVLKGDSYTVTVAGTFFTAEVEAGDMLIAEVDAAAAEADWTIVQSNLTAGSIKTAYESNADTNAYTDAEAAKLAGIEASADVTDFTNVSAALAAASGSVAVNSQKITGLASGAASGEAVHYSQLEYSLNGVIPNAVLALPNAVVDGDYVEIGTDLYEWDDGGGTAQPGAITVLLGGGIADARTNLITAINTSGTENVKATADGTGVMIQPADAPGGTVVAANPDILLAETITDVADIWVCGAVNLNTLGGEATALKRKCTASITITTAMVAGASYRLFDAPFTPSRIKGVFVRTAVGAIRYDVTDQFTITGNGVTWTSAGATHLVNTNVVEVEVIG